MTRAISIKKPDEVNIMRTSGHILAEILNELRKIVIPGREVFDLENRFMELVKKYGADPACKGYAPYGSQPFPTGLCVSINDQSVHCYPVKGVVINEGDIVTVDTAIKYRKLHVDAAIATVAGAASEKRLKLLAVTKNALDLATEKVSPGARIGVISHTLQKVVEAAGFNVLHDYAGHGIGTEMHEAPEILCYGSPKSGEVLKPGMTICIEALVCEGRPKINHQGMWNTHMADGKDFCQFENTILVTNSGYEILTK